MSINWREPTGTKKRIHAMEWLDWTLKIEIKNEKYISPVAILSTRISHFERTISQERLSI